MPDFKDDFMFSPLPGSHVFQAHAAAGTDAFARLLDTLQKARIVFKPIFEPVILRLKPDQNPGGLAVARDNDLALRRFAQQMRQVVLDFRQRDFPYAGLPNRASHAAASDLLTIARISTVEPVT